MALEPRAPIRYRFDPLHPVPTLGGNLSSQGALATQGATDQRCHPEHWTCPDSTPLAAPDDLLLFQQPPTRKGPAVTRRPLAR